jgi:hypothetical protein
MLSGCADVLELTDFERQTMIWALQLVGIIVSLHFQVANVRSKNRMVTPFPRILVTL